jgi:hypothetical protein
MEVPGHASYPSGHSTESHLIAHLLNRVIGEEHPARRFLCPLADRIALNREVVGLHYRSDSEAGVRLADKIKNILDNIADDEKSIFGSTVIAAREEWTKLIYGSHNRA